MYNLFNIKNYEEDITDENATKSTSYICWAALTD